MLHGVFLVIVSGYNHQHNGVNQVQTIIHKHCGFTIVKPGMQLPYNQMEAIIHKE
jgi:hypothetical protein